MAIVYDVISFTGTGTSYKDRSDRAKGLAENIASFLYNHGFEFVKKVEWDTPTSNTKLIIKHTESEIRLAFDHLHETTRNYIFVQPIDENDVFYGGYNSIVFASGIASLTYSANICVVKNSKWGTILNFNDYNTSGLEKPSIILVKVKKDGNAHWLVHMKGSFYSPDGTMSSLSFPTSRYTTFPLANNDIIMTENAFIENGVISTALADGVYTYTTGSTALTAGEYSIGGKNYFQPSDSTGPIYSLFTY